MNSIIKQILLLTFISLSSIAFGQSEKSNRQTPLPPPPPPPKPKEEIVYRVVEYMPRFPGCEDLAGTWKEKRECGNEKFLSFIYKHLEYPDYARINKIEGTVFVSFVISKNVMY